MNFTVLSKSYGDLPFCESEILRYAGCKKADSEILSLLRSCIEEIRGKFNCMVCYCELPVSAHAGVCDFGAFAFRSRKLEANLKNCETVILFAATVGIEIDRLTAKYGCISPSRALMFQAIGTQYIETLCDFFCKDIADEKNMSLKPRFSPGYGDLPLDTQHNIFALLNCPKHIGLTLNDSLLMSPSKSVTAFVGLTKENTTENKSKCIFCDNLNCMFRGAV